MKIWVDADACPKVIKEIIFRAAERTQTKTTLVANQPVFTPVGDLITSKRVEQGFDVADNYIAQEVVEGDLVITADIPLAADVIAKKALALNPRGQLYDENNIRQRLAMRNFMEEMRSIGEASGGPAPLNHTDRREFANALDRLLASQG